MKPTARKLATITTASIWFIALAGCTGPCFEPSGEVLVAIGFARNDQSGSAPLQGLHTQLAHHSEVAVESGRRICHATAYATGKPEALLGILEKQISGDAQIYELTLTNRMSSDPAEALSEITRLRADIDALRDEFAERDASLRFPVLYSLDLETGSLVHVKHAEKPIWVAISEAVSPPSAEQGSSARD